MQYQPRRFETMFLSPIRTFNEKAAARKQAGHDIVFFTMGEPDFDTPAPIKEATIRALQANQTHYAPMRGILALRQKISQDFSMRYGVQYDPEREIIVTCGGAEGLNNAIFSAVGPGDEVILFEPAFMHYTNMVTAAGGQPVVVQTRFEDGFQIDPDTLRAAITPRTKMLILNNPGNPTGAVYTKQTLEAVCKIACEYDLLVLSDEIYSRIVYDGSEFYSVASFPGMRERTLTMNGFSKTYAMTGWRMAYIAADEKLMRTVAITHQYSTTCESTFSQVGMAQAMGLPETELAVQQMVEAFARRRTLLDEGLSGIKNLAHTVPQGAIYVLVDVSATGMDGEAFASRLLEEADVAAVPAGAFGAISANCIRLSFAASEAQIKEGLKRIAAFTEHL